ncbi:MAG: hypothetical protein IPM54_24055 [Polyangiaceae bacterium]|nr:hypothetical protein [Polyangiaceae bacterium]
MELATTLSRGKPPCPSHDALDHVGGAPLSAPNNTASSTDGSLNGSPADDDRVDSLFDQIVQRSGLSPVFAKGTIQRAFARIGVDPNKMKRDDVERALPSLQAALAVFLPPNELQKRMQDIGRLAR